MYFFGDTICLLTNRKMTKIATLIDLHIVLTYDCMLTLLFSLRYLNESCFENDNTFLFIRPLSCFVFHLSNLLLTQNFVYPTLGKCKLVFQNHPQRYEKLVSYYSDTAIDQRKIRWLERDLNSHLPRALNLPK
jgi:hypothetical protein